METSSKAVPAKMNELTPQNPSNLINIQCAFTAKFEREVLRVAANSNNVPTFLGE